MNSSKNVKQTEPMGAVDFFKRGLAYDKQGNYSQAAWDYSKAIEQNPEYADAYNNLGVAHAEEGFFDDAISDFNKAIKINPNDPDFYTNRSLVHLKLFYLKKRPKKVTVNFIKNGMRKAMTDIKRAIKLNPDYARLPSTTIGMPLRSRSAGRIRLYRVKSQPSGANGARHVTRPK